MQVAENNTYSICFKSGPLITATSFIEDRVLLNKALLDGARDISTVMHTNSKNEREERIRKACIAWSTAFLTPIVTLPLTNRLAMKHVAKLTKSYSSHENNLIELSNKYLSSFDTTFRGIKELMKKSDYSEFLKKYDYDYEKIRLELIKNNVIKLPKRYLKSAETTKKGIEKLSKKYDFSDLLRRNHYDYDEIRKKLINAKMSVLSFDFLFTSALLGGTGFINRWNTRKKTGRDGFSAEFNMADNDLIEKRAKKYKQTETLRNNIFISALLLLTASPLILRKGLLAYNGKLADFAKKHADKFDYNDGIFMKRLPFLLMTLVTDIGLLMSSRNQTEIKDNAVRISATQIAFFGGDIVIGSALAALSDKLFKTELLDENCKKNWINKLIPPIKPIRDLQGKNKSIATGLFWVNMVTLFGIIGIAIPKILNKMIRHDVEKDANKQIQSDEVINIINKQLKMEDFIKKTKQK